MFYVQYGAQFSATFCSTFIFIEPQMNLNKKKLIPKVAWLLVFRPAEFWVYSYYILWARRGDAKVGDFGFPENVFVYGYSNYMVKFKFIFYPYRRPKWANSWHKERRVIKLSVKYKLLLGCVILWPKYTPQYFLSTFAYLPILGHPARRWAGRGRGTEILNTFSSAVARMKERSVLTVDMNWNYEFWLDLV